VTPGPGLDMIGPLPAYLRQAKDDVTLIAAPTGDEIWLVSDYQLARQVLTDKRCSRSEAVKPGVPKFNDAQPVAQSVMSMDGPQHARLRRIIASQLSPRRAAEMVPFIEQLTDGYLDRLTAQGPPADLVEGLAAPLPLAVLGRLLGVPEEDIGQFKDRVAVLFDISAGRPKGTARSRIELARYMTYLTGYKRQHPGEDLLTTLISAHDRDELSKSEMITMGLALLAAGFETTAGQISLMVMVMLADPGTYRKLGSQPEILPAVIDEALRLSPVAPMSFTRAAQEPVRLGRTVIEPGQAVAVSLFQANRDDEVFPKPDELMLEERQWPQLTFGYGSHRCPGAHLARAQLSVVLARLAQRFPALRLADGPEPVSWKQGIATRGLSRLMVTW
jgi:cytochrome P450